MAEAIRQGDIPGVQLRRRQSLAVSAEEAWRWLSEPDRLALWLAEQAELTEGELTLTGEGYRERGRTIEIVPPKLWVLAFERLDSGWTSATRLALRVHPLPASSEVDVLQDGFQRLPLSACLTIWETYRRRWRDALSKLAEIAVPIS
ncbi:MAG TPA: SRPBCC domain-containing protein [Thermoanaerobaculia bacterium]|nr:SRPBCC domain-containing protein [Thermoanaerobaculia bacterium]